MVSRHSANSRSVVSVDVSVAKRTNRIRDQAEHRAEQLPAAFLRPVDHQILARGVHPRAEHPVLAAPVPLHLRHQTTEVPVAALVASGPGDRQQPLRRDPPPRRLHLVHHDLAEPVDVAPRRAPRSGHIGAGPRGFDDPLHGLVGRAAQLRGRPVACPSPRTQR
ncbi:MAG: hypothetical protein M3O70_15745 [Actinomycetota bacterium]|nr:hypothetical protein [Actinomycetota bacterium]